MSDPLTSAIPSAATFHAKPRFPRILLVALTALALLILFEVGVRCLQPDTLTYTATIADGSYASPTYQHVHLTITDPQAVARWYSAVHARPLGNVVSIIFLHCNGLYYSGESYRFEFTWHGLPIETATGNDMNCGPALWLNSGGLPSLRAYTLPNPLPTPIP